MLRSFYWQSVAMASALILNSTLCFGAVSPDTKLHSDKSNSTLQVARYSVITPQASEAQQDLLAMARPLDIPQDILTVGEALNWLLVPSGYRLIEEEYFSEGLIGLLGLPLPQVHREFEALPLRAVIRLIVGPAFILIEDPIHRLVTIEQCGVKQQQILAEGV